MKRETIKSKKQTAQFWLSSLFFVLLFDSFCDILFADLKVGGPHYVIFLS